MTVRRALITGITGQDGSYLAELLLEKGYEVHGVIRRSSSFNTDRIDHIYQDPQESGRRLILHHGDLNDASSLNRILRVVNPEEIYNLGAQSHVKVSFDVPEYTAEIDAVGVLRLLECIREVDLRPRIYQASSSEIFGATPPPQNEQTPFHPRSPYAVSKLFAYWAIVNYREAYGLFGVNGILFNHESPRRGETFVTRKVTRAAGRIRHGLQDRLYVGNLDAVRDWGYARDYVEAMWLMLQQDTPDDYVIATGVAHSVRELCELAFATAGFAIEWRGAGVDEQGLERGTGRVLVEIDPRYFRPSEVDNLRGDPSKARERLGWQPATTFEELIALMVESDLALAERELRVQGSPA
jgi:GDPmannose 4,6-dehydratase